MKTPTVLRYFALLVLSTVPTAGPAAAFHNPYGKFPTNPLPGDALFANYFRSETRLLSDRALGEARTAEEWFRLKPIYRAQLFEMLGLDPLPPKTDLKPTVTGTVDHPDFTVEKLHFQSRPGLYVSGNLYVPKGLVRPAPAILYVCGHAQVKTNGISYGAKVAYQHHGIWFARNGYVCLLIDTVQLGEIEGKHHGTHREGMWWWNSRGYSSAAAEAWNCIRALDYLETRPEVDKTRFGVTGRSGGGAYSWWVAALDERVKATCPVAGITDLENHVVDGVVEGHCDCMFMVNTHRWDYAMVAALVAPRPLLICNSDKDTIFPLDGVLRVHEKVRKIYDLEGAANKLGLLITEGPHRDTQDLQLPVFRWFNRFLKQTDAPVEMAARPLFTGQQLKVFDRPPEDEITSRCYEDFTELANATSAGGSGVSLTELRGKIFGGWPDIKGAPAVRAARSAARDGARYTVYEFESQPGITLRLYAIQPTRGKARELRMEVVDPERWRRHLRLAQAGFAPLVREELEIEVAGGGHSSGAAADEFLNWTRETRDRRVAWLTIVPRGMGITAFTDSGPYAIHLRRRFMLLGQTLAGMRVWDVRRAIQAARQVKEWRSLPLELCAAPEMVEVACFAALFEPEIHSLRLPAKPRPDKQAPDFLNWSRVLTPPQLLGLTERHCRVELQTP
jgi:dienelactone hydrolase